MVVGARSGWWAATVQHPAAAAAAPVVAAAAAVGVGSTSGGDRGEEEYWRRFDNSVNAVSFGFVATAVLISMFLVMAIFERFLRPNSIDPPTGAHANANANVNAAAGPSRSHSRSVNRGLPDDEFHGKFDYPSPKVMVSSTDVSVLMPGEEIPTFIAHTTTPININHVVTCPPSR